MHIYACMHANYVCMYVCMWSKKMHQKKKKRGTELSLSKIKLKLVQWRVLAHSKLVKQEENKTDKEYTINIKSWSSSKKRKITT